MYSQAQVQEVEFYSAILLCFQNQFLSEILRWRAQTSSPDHTLFSLINAKVSFHLACVRVYFHFYIS